MFLQMCIFIECKWIDKRKEVIMDRNLIIKMCSFSICIMCLYYIYIYIYYMQIRVLHFYFFFTFFCKNIFQLT